MAVELTEVFSPGSMPDHTYINRTSEDEGMTYEMKLRKALMKKGNLISITGGTKIGKSVLCNKVVGKDRSVKLSGSQIKKPEDFWQYIAEELEIPTEIQITHSAQTANKTQTAVSAKTAILNLLSAGVSIGKDATTTSGGNTTHKIMRSNALIMNVMIQSGITLIIDDFHYIDKETQLYLARTLKTEIFNGLKAILLSLPHRADEAIRLNPDLIGRMSFIELSPWKESELKEIGRKGFQLLHMKIQNDALELLARESALSPQLMQENCFNIAFRIKTANKQSITLADVRLAMKDTVAEYKHYRDIVLRILDGPAKGRSRRKKYHTKNKAVCDIYDLLLLGLSDDPPQLEFSVAEILERMQHIACEAEKLPTHLNLSKTIKNMEKIVKESMIDADTIDWKNNTLYILDPFLLFYLRWNSDWKNRLYN